MINVQTVLNAITANNNNPSIVIKRFGLTRRVNKTMSNGIVKAGYYLNDELVFELTEPGEIMTPEQIKQARQLLGFNQEQLATALGWTTKRNIVNLEHQTNAKTCTVQTALSIECLLRRANLWERFNKAD